MKFTPAAWYGNGFFYSGFDRPETGQELSAANKYQKVFYHALGDPQDNDKIVYEDKDHPFCYMNAQTTEDKKYLFLSISEGTHGNELHYATLISEKPTFRPLIQGFEYDSNLIDNIGNKFLVYTNADAPNYRVVMINPQNPEKEGWKTVIPEEPEVLNSASTAGGQIFCRYLKDVTTPCVSVRSGWKSSERDPTSLSGNSNRFRGKEG